MNIRRAIDERDAADKAAADPHCPNCHGSGQERLIIEQADIDAGNDGYLGEDIGAMKCRCIPDQP